MIILDESNILCDGFIIKKDNDKKRKEEESVVPTDWETPSFIRIKKKRTKRLSPYLETELWERDELLSIIK